MAVCSLTHLVLSDQQSKNKCFIYSDLKHRKAVNPHIRETGTGEYLVFLLKKLYKQIIKINYQKSC